jgi:hypothetical protein
MDPLRGSPQKLMNAVYDADIEFREIKRAVRPATEEENEDIKIIRKVLNEFKMKCSRGELLLREAETSVIIGWETLRRRRRCYLR